MMMTTNLKGTDTSHLMCRRYIWIVTTHTCMHAHTCTHCCSSVYWLSDTQSTCKMSRPDDQFYYCGHCPTQLHDVESFLKRW